MNKQLKIIFFILAFVSITYGNESLSKLGLSKFEAEDIFKKIDSYKIEADKFLKKIKDKDPIVQGSGVKFFIDLPFAPSDIIVKAFLNEKNSEIKSKLKEIIKASINKPSYEDWTQSTLEALTEHLSEKKGSTNDLLEIARRNNSEELSTILENALKKNTEGVELLKIYKISEDKIKLVLFNTVSDSLDDKGIQQALSSPLESLRFKAVKHQINKNNEKAISILFDFINSKNKKLAKDSIQLLTSTKNIDLAPEIKKQVTKLGSDSEKERENAKAILLALPSSTARQIEKVGLEIYRQTDNAEIKLSFLNIIKSRISEIMDRPGYIGVQLEERIVDGFINVFIRNTIANTPASKANIPGNSQILKIDEVSFHNSNLTTLRAHLKTLTAGTKIKIALKTSSGENVIKEITMTGKSSVTDYMLFNTWKAKSLGTATSFNR